MQEEQFDNYEIYKPVVTYRYDDGIYKDYVISPSGDVRRKNFNRSLNVKIVYGRYTVRMKSSLTNEYIINDIDRMLMHTFKPIDVTCIKTPYIEHIDGNRLNNDLDNLKWISKVPIGKSGLKVYDGLIKWVNDNFDIGTKSDCIQSKDLINEYNIANADNKAISTQRICDSLRDIPSIVKNNKKIYLLKKKIIT